ncbi:MAG: cupin domain-containing protein [Proteobacteria bacterium]|jgi:mannose-6-phosphate isomerase-like protein (cupin superfamily)|nr:cupin domain-containing protein [Pseudomonadota bacterium]
MIKLVEKVWGNEVWLVNREYCGKFLNLKKGFKCSLHCHHIKDETFIIMDGKVLMEVDGQIRTMGPMDIQTIEPHQKHRFTGLEDSKILEISTHHEDSDSYREEESGPA